MAIDPKAVHKPFNKLRKMLKNFPDTPSPENVHDIRTQTRRIEAIANAFRLDEKKIGSALLRSLKPIRKAAGNVRDMDVLTDFAVSLDPGSDRECRLQLIEHLAARRTNAASKLAKKVNSKVNQVRARLKQCGKVAEAGLNAAGSRDAKAKNKEKSRQKASRSMASSFDIEQELRDWPILNDKNIHPFRLKVKEWRYILQLGQNSDSKLVDELGEIKDQIGLWHDWNELRCIASDVLDHGAGCAISPQIRTRTKQELDKALKRANNLRAQYLQGDPGRNRKKKGVVAEIHPAVARATSRLAG
jgi:CHAD domain-containing protein